IIKSFFFAVLAHFALQVSFFSPDYGLREILGLEIQSTPAKAFYHTHHDASKPATGLPIVEFLKETELQEKPPLYKVYNFYSDFDLIKSASIGTSKNLYRGFLRSLQNRPTLSLFILHHSWKSYLS
ncbi:MAG TPA: hypothetical protein VGK39_07855, partial [Cyclobacteriaceae bacterium]